MTAGERQKTCSTLLGFWQAAAQTPSSVKISTGQQNTEKSSFLVCSYDRSKGTKDPVKTSGLIETTFRAILLVQAFPESS